MSVSGDVDKPVVSVALLTHNGMPELATLLDRLRRQTLAEPWELVAIDTASGDGSRAALADAGARVEEISPDAFSFGPTRDRLFELTRGDVIVTLSQDAVPVGDDLLERLVRPILSGELDMVIGDERRSTETGFYWHRDWAWFGPSPYDHWPPRMQAVSCVCLALSRAAWRQTGFGQTPMSEDKHLALRAAEVGLRWRQDEHAVVDHVHDYDLRGLIKRSYNEGVGGRWTDGRYAWWRMLVDLVRLRRYRRLLAGLWHGQIRTPAEFLFIWVRPVALWWGLSFGRTYWR